MHSPSGSRSGSRSPSRSRSGSRTRTRNRSRSPYSPVRASGPYDDHFEVNVSDTGCTLHAGSTPPRHSPTWSERRREKPPHPINTRLPTVNLRFNSSLRINNLSFSNNLRINNKDHLTIVINNKDRLTKVINNNLALGTMTLRPGIVSNTSSLRLPNQFDLDFNNPDRFLMILGIETRGVNQLTFPPLFQRSILGTIWTETRFLESIQWTISTDQRQWIS
ncbi:hypothetical protein M427DRAFT_50246 [Gonapodya prolifera JEL478]|uniref:Uncharacterized protein n=1 Tax=Gonapodya prolifera (strain JEL478) TaxID=1344416 RepID=A0A138ZWJ6_GONPJ|nr:hypothetical protein M427DRAFT_50246 [Gonapodya prolifera JEL478]|eukprot:KXS08872.1 hypothetical protein M427DRAFT_50246 [Gonapodya prolifera JEL478]